MTDINVGQVAVAGGTYEVILRPVPPAYPPAVPAPNNNNGNNNNGNNNNGDNNYPPAMPPGNGDQADAMPAVPAPVYPPGKGGGKKGKKTKGTRKLSGYMKFAQEERPKLLKENPSLKSDIPGIGRALGAKWRALSEAEKARY